MKLQLRRAAWFVLIFVCIVVLLLSLTDLNMAKADEEAGTAQVRVRLAIRIYDIDLSTKKADIKIFAFITDFPRNDSQIDMSIIAGAYFIIKCNVTSRVANGWFYQGESD
jgi:hypothetical protein